MKVFWVGLLVLSMAAYGQHAGGFSAGFGGFGRGRITVVGPGAGSRAPAFRGQFGLPQLQPIPPLGGEPLLFRRGQFRGNQFGRLFNGSSLYPLVWPAYYDDGTYSSPPAGPNIILVQPPPPPALQAAVPEPSPKPALSVVHEYHFSEAASAPPPPIDERAYVIALKDGSKDFAVALWVQGRTLQYIDRDGNQRHVALSEIDRSLTEKLNREQQLPLSLPAI